MILKKIFITPFVLLEKAINRFFDAVVGVFTKLKLDYYGAQYGKDCKFRGKARITIYRNGHCIIGNGFRCLSGIRYCVSSNDPSKIVVWPGAFLNIGDNVGVSATSFACKGRIEIGNNVRIGSGCVIHDTDHHSSNPKIRTGKDKTLDVANAVKKPVIIKDNVFIGARCLILKGVVIGENSIVGAGSVVTKNIPDNEIWAGNPAKFIRKIEL